jgi:hypothetical protein
MRILIKHPETSVETVLCDGPGRGVDRNTGPLDGLAIDDQVNVQPAEFIRAAEGKFFNRGNQRTSLTFRVARECRDIVAAHAWQVGFHAGCVRNGTVRLTETDTNGLTQVVRIENAVITAIKTTPMGVTRIIEFNIVGGKLTA